jgi:hypothetical protein
MFVLFVLGVVSLLAYLNLLIIRSFRRRSVGPGWWTMLIIAWAAGSALGFVGGFFFEYQPSPHLRVAGAPVPGAFFRWEGPPGEEQWVDYITPAPLLCAGSNVAIIGLLAACPIGLAFWLQRRRTVKSAST